MKTNQVVPNRLKKIKQRIFKFYKCEVNQFNKIIGIK